MYGEGISNEGGLLDVGVAMDVVTKTGAWFTFGETRLGQGREASKEFLKANADVAAEIERQIRAKMNDVALPGRGRSKRRSRPADVTDEAGGRRPPVPKLRGAPRRERRDQVERSRGGARRRRALPRGAAASIAEVRRRLTLGWAIAAALVDDAVTRHDRARLPRRRGVRAGLGRVTGSGASAWRASAATRAAAEGRRARGIDRGRPRRARTRPADGERRGWAVSADEVGRRAAARRRAALAPPRAATRGERRQKAYALLARSGFAPDVVRRAVSRDRVLCRRERAGRLRRPVDAMAFRRHGRPGGTRHRPVRVRRS